MDLAEQLERIASDPSDPDMAALASKALDASDDNDNASRGPRFAYVDNLPKMNRKARRALLRRGGAL